MKILLSIKPKFAEKIFSGEKIFEFRRKIWKRPVDSMVIYVTAPVGKILGEAVLDRVHQGSPEDIWNQCCQGAGVDREYFFEYFKGRNKAFAIEIERAYMYPAPVNIMSKYGKRPPQSFLYVDA